MPESKAQKGLENKNSRVNKIVENLMKRTPTMKNMDMWNESEPEFPTFPTPSLREKTKRSGKNPFLGGGRGSI